MEPKKNLPKMKMQPLPLQEEHASVPKRVRSSPGRSYASRKYDRSRFPRKQVQRPAMAGFFLQSLACGMIFLMVLVLQQINTPVGEGILNGLSFVVSENMDWSLWPAGGVREDAITVSGSAERLTPATGEGIKLEGGWTHYDKAGPIRAVMDGTIFYLGEDDSGRPYARLRHGGGFESWYAGVELTAEVGQTLRAGDILGRMQEGENLVFCLRQEGTIVDHTALAADPG